MPKKLNLISTSPDNEWDKLVERSPYSSIFFHSSFLKNLLSCNLRHYKIFNGGELRGLLLLCTSIDSASCIQNDLLVYSGICFGPPTNNQSYAQQISEQFDISSYIANYLAQEYKSVDIQLPPSVHDIRPFLWYNYNSDLPKYTAIPRFTSLLNISGLSETTNYENHPIFMNSSSSRRQQIRYSIRDRIEVHESNDVQKFLDLYQLTFKRQSIDISADKLNQTGNLVQGLLDNKMAKVFFSYLPTGEPASVAVFGLNNKQSCYLFGANDPDHRHTSSGTAILWQSFRKLAEYGCTTIDLEGVNSPNRGWFKLSFGGKLLTYYQLKFENVLSNRA